MRFANKLETALNVNEKLILKYQSKFTLFLEITSEVSNGMATAVTDNIFGLVFNKEITAREQSRSLDN